MMHLHLGYVSLKAVGKFRLHTSCSGQAIRNDKRMYIRSIHFFTIRVTTDKQTLKRTDKSSYRRPNRSLTRARNSSFSGDNRDKEEALIHLEKGKDGETLAMLVAQCRILSVCHLLQLSEFQMSHS